MAMQRTNKAEPPKGKSAKNEKGPSKKKNHGNKQLKQQKRRKEHSSSISSTVELLAESYSEDCVDTGDTADFCVVCNGYFM